MSSQRRLAAALSVFALAASAVVASCSSSSSPGGGAAQCNSNPWSCPSGQTCWITDATGAAFACLNSKQGAKKGDACVNSPGSATCGDLMACFQQSVSGGICVTYCDNTKTDRGCAAGEQCVPVSYDHHTTAFSACIPTGAPPGDAGSDTGTSDSAPPDSGTGDTGGVPPDSSGGGGG